MQTSRRTWLKYMGMGIAGMGLSRLDSYASPVSSYLLPDATDATEPLRLSANENPYGPSPAAIRAMSDSIGKSNRYGWNTVGDLITAIATKNNLPEDHILIGPGSTEILDLAVRSFGTKGSFVVAQPSYTSWTKTAEYLGLKKITVPLTTDKACDLDAMLAAIKPDTRFVYLCNPNNPTGTLCKKEALSAFIEEAGKKVTVLVDEAYLDFTDQASAATAVVQNRNLIVVKTFSKIYGLAGARIGYALAHADTIARLSGLQTWANGGVSVASRAAAIASLKDTAFVQQCYDKNKAVKQYTVEELAKLHIPSIPSHTNFLYFSLADYKKDFFALLQQNNIQGTDIYEAAGKWTRITIGTQQEMQRFIATIQ